MAVRSFFTICLAVIFCGVASAQEGVPQKTWVGVLPVADASGEAYSEVVGQYLTGMIFQQLQSTASSLQPMLLNPGGLYNPLSSEWTLEYSHRIGVDLVIISSILPSDKPKKGDWTLRVQAQLMDVASGKTSSSFMGTARIDKRHLIANPSSNGEFADSPADYLHRGTGSISILLLDDRPFEKQPLGKATKSIAEAIGTEAVSMAPTVSSSTSAPVPVAKGGPCDVSFGVSYGKKISTAYDFVVNGLNESLGMVDGLAKFSAPSGPVIVKVVVHDPPYRLPIQRLYQANTYLDCGFPNPSLRLEIGPTGEASLQWK
jgi:hypothetical protein